ncbi:DNA polymerase/3'-5' exonuclease PolX [Candidatus Thorarchaeota archaeon]|nr:MAG: DNA polymerase/3'-5' exonuclease PolX [Candidatus Thorarchaeota archaeon]
MVKNQEVADILYEIADYLEIKGVQWKPRAYRRAAGAIETLSDPIEEVYHQGELQEVSGVGESIAEKIAEYLQRGELEYLNNLREEMPQGLRSLMAVEGIGPKMAEKLYQELKITTVDELEHAAQNHKIRELEGFGEKTEQNILENISMYRESHERFVLGYMLPDVEEIKTQLDELDYVSRVEIAGSTRRRRPTIGDADILVISDNSSKVMDFFTSSEKVARVLSKGERKSTVVLKNNLQVDLLVIDEKNFGAALLYFTGSKDHNIALRKRAIDHNWKLSEYGLEDRESEETLASKTEDEIYRKLELEYIIPELRENRGEIKAAGEGRLPEVLNFEHLKSDLHVHSDWSEGVHSMKEMALTAKASGLKFLALCDHTQGLGIASGLDEDDFQERQKEIDKVNEELEEFTILPGAEVNIDSDGKLDLANDALEELDVVVAAIHSGLSQSQEQITERILSAIHNEHVDIIGHLTGRLLNKRQPYELGLPAIYSAAEDQDVCLEINCFPTRMDLPDSHLIDAKDHDLRFSIGTDSHSTEHLRFIELGVTLARRGWIEPNRVINTLELAELKKQLGI